MMDAKIVKYFNNASIETKINFFNSIDCNNIDFSEAPKDLSVDEHDKK